MTSFAPEVQTTGDAAWTGNGLLFATRDEAAAWVSALADRWHAVTNTRVVESELPANRGSIDFSRVFVVKGNALIGTAVERGEGWLFFPNTSGHKRGRIRRATSSEAIPRWAKRLATDFLNAEEWKAVNSGSAS